MRKNILSSLQWYGFILSFSVIAPVAIGTAFGFSAAELASFVQHTLFIVGVSSLLQVWFGHKLPIAECPSGMWWAFFLIIAQLPATMPGGIQTTLQSIEMGIILGGVLMMVLSLFKSINAISTVFTNKVIGTYLILLVVQLSGSFINGILGVGYLSGDITARVAVPAMVVVIISVLFAKSKVPLLKNFSVLFSMVIGWVLFALLGLTKSAIVEASVLIALPKVFAWGPPRFDLGVVITSMVTVMMVLVNQISSIQVIEKLVDRPPQPVYNRSGFVLGINQVLAGVFLAVPTVGVTTTAGFIETTGSKEKLPFVAGSLLIVIMSLFPAVMLFFATLPVPVAYATILLSFASIIGLGLKEFRALEYNENNLFIICFSLMLGIGAMFIPKDSFRYVPTFLVPLFTNGIIIGVLTCILLEQGGKLLGRLNKIQG